MKIGRLRLVSDVIAFEIFMYFESPSARIKETQQILDRLEKRLEKYYKPVDIVTTKSEELNNLKAKIVKNITKNDSISKSPSQ